MKKITLAALAATTLVSLPAHAVTLKFAFSSINGDSGSGVFTTTVSGRYNIINGVSGVVNGRKIVGLSDYKSSDQKLKLHSQFPGNSHFTLYGVSFEDAAGELYNFTAYPTFDRDYILNSVQGDETPSEMQFSVEAVPEPATWGLFIAGFGAVGLSARRRPRAAAVVS